METLKYKVIKTGKQYNSYCVELEKLLESGLKNKAVKEEIELLTLLIKKWDAEHNTFAELDPITLLKSLMTESSLKSKDLAEILGVSKELLSDILSYKKGLSSYTYHTQFTAAKIVKLNYRKIICCFILKK